MQLLKSRFQSSRACIRHNPKRQSNSFRSRSFFFRSFTYFLTKFQLSRILSRKNAFQNVQTCSKDTGSSRTNSCWYNMEDLRIYTRINLASPSCKTFFSTFFTIQNYDYSIKTFFFSDIANNQNSSRRVCSTQFEYSFVREISIRQYTGTPRSINFNGHRKVEKSIFRIAFEVKSAVVQL